MKKKYEWGQGLEPPPIEFHSVAKHEILEEYLTRYVKILASSHRVEKLRLALVDGFSGGGLYRLPGEAGLHEGSPLIFLRAMDSAAEQVNADRIRPFTLDAEFFFVEREQKTVEFLAETVRSRVGGASRWPIRYKVGDFAEHVDAIIDQIASRGRVHRSIFLLDQYGYTDVPVHLLRKIFQRLPKAEVILTFAVDSLLDYISDTSSFRSIITKIGFNEHIDLSEIDKMKSSTNDWRFIIQSQLYKALVGGSRAQFFTPFFIVSRQSNRSYWLVHLSNHVRARDEMMKLHWVKHTYFTHHGGAGLNMLGYDPKRDPGITKQGRLSFVFDEPARELTEGSLMADIPRIISQSSQGMSFAELLAQTCNNTPATSDIYKKAIRCLIDYKELEAVGENGEKRTGQRIADSDTLVIPRQRTIFLR